MGIITKSEITLTNVNDAYSVSLTNPSCVINADYDGSNPKLDNAFTDISINMGSASVNFTCEEVSAEGFESEITQLSNSLIRVRIKSISAVSLGGYNEYKLETVDGYSTVVKFSYTVVRESTMLDWIQDWNNNKTEIGGSYVITPKLFIGKKETLESENGEYNALTGVYIGPDGPLGESAGIYGYQDGQGIFHIDEETASIAGWKFDKEALWIGDKENNTGEFTSKPSDITIGSEGIRGCLWRLEKDGSGALAGGNIEWTNKGEITITINNKSLAETLSSQGETISTHTEQIAAIKLGVEGLSANFTKISSTVEGHDTQIGEQAETLSSQGETISTHTEQIAAIKLGVEGLSANFTKISSTVEGHDTQIGELLVDSGKFKTNFQSIGQSLKEHGTSIKQNSESIQLIATGLTETGINITDGSINLHSGDNSWQLNSTGESTISGWLISEYKLATDHICFNSFDGMSGLYMSAHADASFKTRLMGFENFIDDNGGIYINVNDNGAEFAGYDNNGKKIFKLKTDEASSIAGWSFDKDDLYTGIKVTTGFAGSGAITLGPSGIRGHKWRFENNGAGAIAGGNISWDANGSVEFSDDVKLMWASNADKLALVAQKMAYSDMLFDDPEFAKSEFNGSKPYPYNTTDVRELDVDNTSPNSSHIVMSMTSTTWADTNPYYRVSGFCFANQSRANAQFVTRIVAKIPKNWEIWNHHNAHGNGSSTEWLTSQEGTGEWEEYVCLVKCGAEGTFSTINHFALHPKNINDVVFDGGSFASAVTWKVAYATVFDITTKTKTITYIDKNGIYTGTLSADQIKTGKIDAELLNVDDIFAKGAIKSTQILVPFIGKDISTAKTYSGITFDDKDTTNLMFYNSYGRYAFLPCDIKHSGRTITIYHADDNSDNGGQPIYLVCNEKQSRFLELGKTYSYNEKRIRVITVYVGSAIQLIALPHRYNANFVDWYIVGCDANTLTNNGFGLMYDDTITDSLWTDYYNASKGNVI